MGIQSKNSGKGGLDSSDRVLIGLQRSFCIGFVEKVVGVFYTKYNVKFSEILGYPKLVLVVN